VAKPTLYLSPTAQAEVNKRRQELMEANLDDAGELLKSLRSEAPADMPRKIIPALLPLGAYRGIKDPRKATRITFDLLRGMSETFIGRLVLNTRALQARQFFREPRSEQDTGWKTVMRDQDGRPSLADRKRMAFIDNICYNMGLVTKRPGDGARGAWGPGYEEKALSMDLAVSAFLWDSLSMDAAAMWFVPGEDQNRWPVVHAKALDAGLMRFPQQPVDPDQVPAGYETGPEAYKPEVNRRLRPGQAEFVMVDPRTHEVVQDFPYGEVCYWIRNPRTAWWVGGYGFSEMESLIQIVTGLLNAATYNTSYFNENHVPPGLLMLSGDFTDELSLNWLNNFVDTLVNLISGGDKRHRLPMAVAPEGAKLVYESLRDYQQDDMKMREFSLFFLNIFLANYHIAAEEVNFQAYLTRGGGLQGDQAPERVAEQQRIGLRDLLFGLERMMSYHLVEPWDFDEATGMSPYRGRLQNVERSDEAKDQEMMLARIAGGYSAVNQERAKRDDPPVRDPKNRALWQALEEKACEMNPRLRYLPVELDELVAKVYQKQGGELRDWPDMPIGPNAAGARQQEIMAEQNQGGMMSAGGPAGGPMGPEVAQGGAGGGDDMGAAMGLPPGMAKGPSGPMQRLPANTPNELEKSLREAMFAEQRSGKPVYLEVRL
jgi:hypothetical protein